jgi:hypothetical protein
VAHTNGKFQYILSEVDLDVLSAVKGEQVQETPGYCLDASKKCLPHATHSICYPLFGLNLFII